MSWYWATEQQVKSWSVPLGWMGYRVEPMEIPGFGAETSYQYGKIVPANVLVRISYPYNLRAHAKQQKRYQDEPSLPSDPFYGIRFQDSSWDLNYILHGVMLSAGVRIIEKKGAIAPVIIGFQCDEAMREFQMSMKKTPGLEVQEQCMGPDWTGCLISGFLNRYSLKMAFGVGMDARNNVKIYFAAANEKLMKNITTLIMTTGGDIIAPNALPIK